ncbi:unnamed protein product [Brassica rapa subsp. trilocularis]
MKENGIPSIGWSHRRRITARSLFFAVALLLLGGSKVMKRHDRSSSLGFV